MIEQNLFITNKERYRAQINRQSLIALQQWIERCNAPPISWSFYSGWPSFVPKDFLNLVEEKNEVTLLIIAHWCGVLYQLKTLGIKAWAYRAGRYVMEEIQNREWWYDSLEWPLQVLHYWRQAGCTSASNRSTCESRRAQYAQSGAGNIISNEGGSPQNYVVGGSNNRQVNTPGVYNESPLST
jgi:hypothetical protein